MEAQLRNKISRKIVLSKMIEDDAATSADEVAGYRKSLFQLTRPIWLDDLLTSLTHSTGKKSFLIAKGNKYVNVLTENIALFYIKHESTMILCFDKQIYYANYTLEQVQTLLPENQFYRINRQYLINFSAVKEVEHYFQRKLLVNSVIPTEDKLIVSKERVADFLQWLDNR